MQCSPHPRHFTDEEKKDQWARIVAPADASGVISEREGSGPAPVHSPLTLYSTLITPGVSLPHTFPTDAFPTARGSARKAYIHVVQTSGYNPTESSGATVKISGDGATLELKEGDGAYIYGEAGTDMNVDNIGDRVAEVLLFDVE